MKIGILGSPDSWHCQELDQAWNKRGVSPVFIDPRAMVAHLGDHSGVTSAMISMGQMDLVMVRSIPSGSLEQVIYRMDALHQLENFGLRIVNTPGAIEKMVDKYYTLSLIEQAGLLVPATRVMEGGEDALLAFDQLGRDVVVKPLFGSRGVGVERITDKEDAKLIFDGLIKAGSIYYLQKFIPHGDRDYRVLVMSGKCIAAMERVASSWKTNISQGATARKVELDREIEDNSLRAARAVGADYCGVDLMRGENGRLYTLEVNSMPAWQGLQTVTVFNIADRLVDYCLSII